MKAILAVNKKGWIGLNGSIPCHSKPDFAHFRSLTMGGTLLVGMNTYMQLPTLKGRTIVLDTREDRNEADWCIGGKKTYEKYMSEFTDVHLSVIDNEIVGDVYCPSFSQLAPSARIYVYLFSRHGDKYSELVAEPGLRDLGNLLTFAARIQRKITTFD